MQQNTPALHGLDDDPADHNIVSIENREIGHHQADDAARVLAEDDHLGKACETSLFRDDLGKSPEQQMRSSGKSLYILQGTKRALCEDSARFPR